MSTLPSWLHGSLIELDCSWPKKNGQNSQIVQIFWAGQDLLGGGEFEDGQELVAVLVPEDVLASWNSLVLEACQDPEDVHVGEKILESDLNHVPEDGLAAVNFQGHKGYQVLYAGQQQDEDQSQEKDQAHVPEDVPELEIDRYLGHVQVLKRSLGPEDDRCPVGNQDLKVDLEPKVDQAPEEALVALEAVQNLSVKVLEDVLDPRSEEVLAEDLDLGYYQALEDGLGPWHVQNLENGPILACDLVLENGQVLDDQAFERLLDPADVQGGLVDHPSAGLIGWKQAAGWNLAVMKV